MNIGERVKNYVLRKLSLDEIYYYRKGKKNFEELEQWPQRKKIFFLMTPSYGNLGDQAIEVATDRFLYDYFRDYFVIKIHLEDIYAYMYKIEKTIGADDIIILQGGGNFGSLYIDIEKKRRFILWRLGGHPIVSMPSSVKYEDTKQGQRELEKSIRTYQNKKNFMIVSRDNFSFHTCQTYFADCINYLSPDMVFFLWENQKNVDRNLMLLCLRMDKEQRKMDFRTDIINGLMKKRDNCVIYDTRVEREIPDMVKHSEIESVLNLFGHAEVVVTDRLHAMIFSAITGTPCIVLPSLDKKIEGTYEWIKEINYIKFIKHPTLENICSSMQELRKITVWNTKPILKASYMTLAEEIKKVVNLSREGLDG